MEPNLKQQLAELARTDSTAGSFFRAAAGSEPDRSETPLDALVSMVHRSGVPVSRIELIRVLRQLEELGCGRYSEAGEGQPARFGWRTGMSKVVRAALAAN
jgi:hypothetical protein